MIIKLVLLEQYKHFITYIHQLCITVIFVWNLERYLVNYTVDMRENIKVTKWPNKSNYRMRYLESIYLISLEPNKNIIQHKGTTFYHWQDCKLLQPLQKKQYGVPPKINIRTTLWPSNSTSVYIFEEVQNCNWKRYMHPYIHCSII